MVRIVSGLGRQVEGNAESGLALFQKIAIALVSLLRRAEASILAHSPEPPSIHGGLDAAGKRIFPREAELGFIIDRRIKPLYLLT